MKVCPLNGVGAFLALSLCAEWRAEAWRARVRPGWLGECPSVHLDVEGYGVQPCSSAGSAAHSSYPVFVGLTLRCYGWWCPQSSRSLPVLCPAQPLLLPIPNSRGHHAFVSHPLSPSLSTFQPLPHLHLLKNGRKKKTVKRGMLTDKPTQLSEASVSVLWMILFTS